MINAPCKNCPDRTIEPNCHTTCKTYKEWRKQENANTEALNRFKRDMTPTSYFQRRR